VDFSGLPHADFTAAAFPLWPRRNLGRLWSSSVTKTADRRLRDRGAAVPRLSQAIEWPRAQLRRINVHCSAPDYVPRHPGNATPALRASPMSASQASGVKSVMPGIGDTLLTDEGAA